MRYWLSFVVLLAVAAATAPAQALRAGDFPFTQVGARLPDHLPPFPGPLTCDIDLDGFDDVITIPRSRRGGGRDAIFIRWGDAERPFEEVTEIDTGEIGSALSCADFDGDGDNDILIAHEYLTLSVLINQGGRAGFVREDIFHSDRGAEQIVLTPANNGVPGGALILSGGFDGPAVFRYFIRTDTGWEQTTRIELDADRLGNSHAYPMTVNVDDDPRLEIAIPFSVSSASKLIVLDVADDSTVSVLIDHDSNDRIESLAWADLGGGPAEEMVRVTRDTVRIFDWDTPERLLGFPHEDATQVELRDFNHDGLTDILVLGESDATFYVNLGDFDFVRHSRSGFGVGLPRAFLADLDGNGLEDICYIENTSGGIRAAYVREPMRVLYERVIVGVNSGAGRPTPFDLDLDGAMDLIVPINASNNYTTLYRWDEMISDFDRVDTSPFAAGQGDAVAILDADSDGRDELVLFLSDHIQTYFQLGPMDFASVESDVPGAGSVNASAAQAYDLNADGHTDIVYLLPNFNRLRYFLGDGAGGFSEQPELAFPSAGPKAFAPSPDAPDEFYIYIGNHPDGDIGVYRWTPGAEPVLDSAVSFPGSIRNLHAADHDADGVHEIVIQATTGFYEVEPEAARAHTEPRLVATLDIIDRVHSIVDVNGDASLEFVIFDQSNQWTAIENLTDAAAASAVYHTFPFELTFFDQDGDSDLDHFTTTNSTITFTRNQHYRPCAHDMNSDGAVDSYELSRVLDRWNNDQPQGYDFDGNRVVNARDLAVILAAWGVCR